MNYLEHLNSSKIVFFNFMDENYTIFQNSNIFFRDFQYAIMSYFEMKEKPIKYADAEQVAYKFIEVLVADGTLTEIDSKSWKLNIAIGIKKEIESEEISNG